MAYSVAERTREIGIRMTLGAGGDDVLRLIARQAAIVISIGLMLGLAGSLALMRLLKSALVVVTATDPATYTAISLALWQWRFWRAWFPLAGRSRLIRRWHSDTSRYLGCAVSTDAELDSRGK